MTDSEKVTLFETEDSGDENIHAPQELVEIFEAAEWIKAVESEKELRTNE